MLLLLNSLLLHLLLLLNSLLLHLLLLLNLLLLHLLLVRTAAASISEPTVRPNPSGVRTAAAGSTGPVYSQRKPSALVSPTSDAAPHLFCSAVCAAPGHGRHCHPDAA